VLHYDADFELLAEMTGQNQEWVVAGAQLTDNTRAARTAIAGDPQRSPTAPRSPPNNLPIPAAHRSSITVTRHARGSAAAGAYPASTTMAFAAKRHPSAATRAGFDNHVLPLAVVEGVGQAGLPFLVTEAGRLVAGTSASARPSPAERPGSGSPPPS
jgi:hypothetical protein